MLNTCIINCIKSSFMRAWFCFYCIVFRCRGILGSRVLSAQIFVLMKSNCQSAVCDMIDLYAQRFCHFLAINITQKEKKIWERILGDSMLCSEGNCSGIIRTSQIPPDESVFLKSQVILMIYEGIWQSFAVMLLSVLPWCVLGYSGLATHQRT